MEQSISERRARLSQIELEYTIKMRERTDGAARAFSALSKLTAEQVKMLEAVVPSISVVSKFTQQELLENLNGEVELLQQAIKDLTSYVDHRLAFYEEQL